MLFINTYLKNHVQSDSPYINAATASFRSDFFPDNAAGRQSRFPRLGGSQDHCELCKRPCPNT